MKNPYETQRDVVAALEQQLLNAHKKLKTLDKYKYPLKASIWVHGDDDSMYSKGKELGLSEEQLRNFTYSANEILFDGEINEDGKFFATHMNGVELGQRIEL